MAFEAYKARLATRVQNIFEALKEPKRYPSLVMVTDFGDQLSLNECKMVIQSASIEAGLQQPLNLVYENDIEPQNIAQGAFAIFQLAKKTPPGTIFIGVIDPGVGTPRDGIIAETLKNHFYVGPNNGIFGPAIHSEGLKRLWKIKEENFNSSDTFQGRDIFSPVAVKLAAGQNPSRFAEVIEPDRLVPLEFEQGQVVWVDGFGNVKIHTEIPPHARSVRLNGDDTHIPVTRTFADVKPGELLVYPGSSDLPELAVRAGNAAERLELKIGDRLDIAWQTAPQTT